MTSNEHQPFLGKRAQAFLQGKPYSSRISADGIDPNVAVTQGSSMFAEFIKGFAGGALQIIGTIAVVIFFLAATASGSGAMWLLFFVSVAVAIYGGFLRYKSKQTVQLGGTHTTKHE